MFLSCAIFFLSFGQNSADSAEVSSCFGVFCGRPTVTNTVKRIIGKFFRSNSFTTRPEFSTGWPFGILKGTSNSETLLKPGQICRAYFVYDDDNVNKFPLEGIPVDVKEFVKRRHQRRHLIERRLMFEYTLLSKKKDAAVARLLWNSILMQKSGKKGTEEITTVQNRLWKQLQALALNGYGVPPYRLSLELEIYETNKTLVDRKCVDLVDNYQKANSSETEFVKRPKLFHFRTYRVRTNIIASSVTANKNNKQLNISSKTSRKSMSNWPTKEQKTFYEEIRIEIDESNLRPCKGNEIVPEPEPEPISEQADRSAADMPQSQQREEYSTVSFNADKKLLALSPFVAERKSTEQEQANSTNKTTKKLSIKTLIKMLRVKTRADASKKEDKPIKQLKNEQKKLQKTLKRDGHKRTSFMARFLAD